MNPKTMFKIPSVALLFLLLFRGPLEAQTDLGAHFLDYSWQSGLSNPAWMPKHTFTIGLPGFSNDFGFTGFTLNDLLRASRGGSLEIDVLLNKLKSDNFIREQLDAKTFYLGYSSDKFAIHFTHGFKFNFFFAFPESFPRLIWDGNAPYIGQEVDFAPDFQATVYQEVALGLAFRLNERVQVGLRGKWLNGWSDVSIASGKNKLSLFTSEDVYQLNMLANYRINHTGQIAYDGIDNFDFELDTALPAGINSNSGWAVDLGASFDLDPFIVSAGVLDLGQISWSRDVGNLTLDGSYTFEGLDAVGDLLMDEGGESVAVLDSLEMFFDFVETQESYTTALPTRLYASGRMRLDDRYSIGLLYVHELYRGYHFPYLAASANASFGRALDAGLLIGYKHGRFSNLGLNVLLKLGPVQLLAATDNLLTVFFPAQSYTSNLRLGLNLAFGRKEVQSKKVQKKEIRAEDFF